MNFEALPDEAQLALKELFRHLDREPFDAHEATRQGVLFILATVRPRLRGTVPAIFNRLEEIAFHHHTRRA